MYSRCFAEVLAVIVPLVLAYCLYWLRFGSSGAVMGISQLDVRVPLSVVSGWGFPSAVVVWIFEKHHSC